MLKIYYIDIWQPLSKPSSFFPQQIILKMTTKSSIMCN